MRFSGAGPENSPCLAALTPRKMSEVSGVMANAEIKPKFTHRAKKWSDGVENLYRFQQAGYRDEIEYKQVKQVDM